MIEETEFFVVKIEEGGVFGEGLGGLVEMHNDKLK